MNLTVGDFLRLTNNFYQSRNVYADINRLQLDLDLSNYLAGNIDKLEKKYKVALCFICINPTYWEYAKPMVEGAKQFFLPGHNVDYLFWTDMPKPEDTENLNRAKDFLEQVIQGRHAQMNTPQEIIDLEKKETWDRTLASLKFTYDCTVFPIEPIEWPMPTLMRYHTFLQQEEKLREYDYVFYCDVDMLFANIVGDEILGEGLTAALHPMYALDKSMWPPYEPNEKSEAFVPRPGQVIVENNQPRYMPMYFAGGLQGGRTKEWIEAMKKMKGMIDKDLINGYIAIWNDESHWNKYLLNVKPAVVLTPSYIYPDSLIKEYYEPRWGRSYPPKLVTITKKHSLKPLSQGDKERLTKVMR